MEIKYGLISADSHAAFEPDSFTSRMSSKWGDRIPRVAAITSQRANQRRLDGFMAGRRRATYAIVPRSWASRFLHGQMRWEEVPRIGLRSAGALKALDIDGVDAEVLFPNPPGGTFTSLATPILRWTSCSAYNDALADWARVSDRYLPLVILPYLNDPK